MAYNPGPGKYNVAGSISPFFKEILKNKDDNSTYYTI